MKFAHISDAQLGYVQYGLASRALDFNNAFIRAIDEAIRQKVDLVVFGGDQFEMAKPAGTYVELVQNQVKRLRMAGIDVVGIEGNHDASGSNWLTVCGIHDLEATPFESHGVRFAGLNYRRENKFLEDLATYASDRPRIDVLVLHQSLLDNTPFATIRASDIVGLLRPKGLRHVAMGHIHTNYAIVVDGVSIVCPGSLEMTDINESRDKFIAITTISGEFNDPATTEFVKIPTRPIMHCVIETEADLEKACQELPESQASILVAAVSRALTDGQLRLTEAAYKGGVPYRITGFNPETERREYTEAPTWDRQHSVIDLAKYVNISFPDPKSNEQGLVNAILAAPMNCADIVKNFITGKLKELDVCQTTR